MVKAVIVRLEHFKTTIKNDRKRLHLASVEQKVSKKIRFDSLHSLWTSRAEMQTITLAENCLGPLSTPDHLTILGRLETAV